MRQTQTSPLLANFEESHDVAGVSAAEWSAVCERRCNLLLEGSETSTGAALQLLMPCLHGVVRWRERAGALELPACRVDTLIVEDVSSLLANEQRLLLAWLAEDGQCTQIISTTTEPLFPLVQRGWFEERLYYRLNVVLLRLQ
jgi:sigma-54-interacting transcriptional regulator